MSDAKPESKANPVLAGWIILVLGLVPLCFSTFDEIPGAKFAGLLYGPLLFIAFFLAVTGLSSKRLVSGLILLLASLIFPAVFWLFFDVAVDLSVDLRESITNQIEQQDASFETKQGTVPD